MVLFSSRISPFTSTVIFFDRSPLATAVVTSAMLRTWPVRFAAIAFTLSVRSFQVPATPGTCAWPPSLPSVPTSRATRVTSPENALSWSTIVLMVLFSSRISPFTSTVILDRKPVRSDVAHLAGEVRRQLVHVVGEVLPGPRHPRHLRLAAELAVSAHLARHARHLAGERVKLVHHRVDGALQLQDLALHVHRDLLRQVALGHRGGHLGDVAHLIGEVRRHRVHVVGEVLPGPRHPRHLRLAAELAVGTHLARPERRRVGKGVEL